MNLTISAASLLLAAALLAQQPPADAAAQQPVPVIAEQPPDQESEPEYKGPAILSRGSTPSIGRGPELRLRPFAHLSAIYDWGLGNFSTDAQGHLNLNDTYGVQASFGVLGHKSWRRTAVNLNYVGQARHYSNSSYQDGLDHMLTLAVDRQLSPRVVLVLQENAARYQHSFFMQSQSWLSADSLLTGVTTGDLFDTPTYLLGSGARIIYQRSARLSFGASGYTMLVRRHSRGLTGVDGELASGDVAYRLSRFQTIGIQYDFGEFRFQHQFGFAYMHGAAVNYSIRLGRHWEANLRAGAFRLELNRERRVQLDPTVAAILGVTSGVEVAHDIRYLPRYDAALTRRFRRASLSANYSRTITPGNGVYLTSGIETASLGFNYSGLRRTSLSSVFGTSRYLGLGQGFSGRLPDFRSYYGTAGMAYRLAHTLSLTLSGSARRYTMGQGGLDRNSYSAQLGLAWSPGDYPFALW